MKTRVGIIGDFHDQNPTHRMTHSALHRAAEHLGGDLTVEWLATDKEHHLDDYDGLFGAPGSPYASFTGALESIRYARENRVPFLGTCGGFQHLVIEFARNVSGLPDAAHAETDPYASRLIVSRLECSLVGKTMEVSIKEGTHAASIFRGKRAQEAFYCNFGLNAAYEEPLIKAGLTISGHDQNGEARIVELADHPFYFGTLFVPQARAETEPPHPLVAAFCKAVFNRRK